MCGFAAILSLDGASIDRERLRRMTTILQHRGPDDEGYLLGDVRGQETRAAGGAHTMPGLDLTALEDLPRRPFTFGLGVRRLAIQDVGPGGHQPMTHHGCGLWLAFNGEIYGHTGLRERIASRAGAGARWTFQTRCDTETMLAALAIDGVHALDGVNGMFALLLWDARRGRLACARDRFGIKPLYYAATAAELLIGSEIKAILAGLEQRPAPNPQAAVDFLTSRVSDHQADTFFEGISQLRPGHLLLADSTGVTTRAWPCGAVDAEMCVEEGGNGDQACGARFHHALGAAVRDHLHSDRRVGATLSGGLDSSSLVVAAAECQAPVGTGTLDVFTAVFDEPACDERGFADEIARVTGASSHYLRILPQVVADEARRVLWHHDEPLFSTSVLAQWQVMRGVAEAGVRVVLDGQGADELLGGYPAVAGAHLADRVRTGDWRGALDLMRSAGTAAGLASLTARAALTLAPGSWHGLTARLAQRQLRGLHADLVGYWRPAVRTNFEPASTRAADRYVAATLETLVRTTSLPALLRALDRNGMAWSVEPRVPFLDPRVAAAARALPNALRHRHGLSKWVLRDPRWSRLPERVRTRATKNGFLTPEAAWWRGPLRDWVADVLDPASVARHGWLDRAVVGHARQRLLSGEAPPDAGLLWRWISIELWADARERGALGRPRRPGA